MNRSGRSVPEASRVIEIDEVLEVRIVCGARCGTSALKIWCLSASRSVAASMTRSVEPSAARSGSIVRRLSAVVALRGADLAARDLPVDVAADDAGRLLPAPRSETSCSATSKPESAKTWAMPLPIWPAPITPTRLISMKPRSRSLISGHHRQAPGGVQRLCPGTLPAARGTRRRLHDRRHRIAFRRRLRNGIAPGGTAMNAIIDFLNTIFWGYVLIYGLLAVGVYFTIRLRLPADPPLRRDVPGRHRHQPQRQRGHHAVPGALHQPREPRRHRQHRRASRWR